MSSEANCNKKSTKKITVSSPRATTATAQSLSVAAAPTSSSSSTGKPQRTIQVKIGNQAAKSMTPDQAADYLKSIAASSNGFFGGSGLHREVKMTFDNGSTSTVALPRTANGSVKTSGNTISASKSNAALLFNGTVRSSSQSSPNNGMSTTTRADGMPCSEKEMKALMSMFVEIMGLHMNIERLNQVSANDKAKTKKICSTSKEDLGAKVLKPATATTGTMPKSTSVAKSPTAIKIQQLKKQSCKPLNKSSSCLKITTTQKIGPHEVITATMQASLPTNKDNLFQFPTDLPPPPGGWPEDLLWPDKSNKHKIVIRNNDISSQHDDLSDVDEDSYDDGKEGETVVVITTTAVDDESYDDEDEDADGLETESAASSVDSLPGLELIPADERHAFRVWQQQRRSLLQKQQNQVLALQKRHEMFLVNGLSAYDDDDDITLEDEEENLVVTGTAGITPFDWSTLERAAMEDALEQEERIRKETSKKRENRNGGRGITSFEGNNRYRSNSISGVTSFDVSYGDSNGANGKLIDIHSANSRQQANISQYQRLNHNIEYNTFKNKVDAANKKLGKAVQSWRNRVAAACHANEVNKLKVLLNGNTLPFNGNGANPSAGSAANSSSSTSQKTTNIPKNKIANTGIKSKGSSTKLEPNSTAAGGENLTEEDRLVQQQFLHPHLEQLVHHCVPKSRQKEATKKGQTARELLTSFILRQSGGIYFMVQPVLRAGGSSSSIIFGRSALDTSCFFSDHSVIQLVVPELFKHFDTEKKAVLDAMSNPNNLGYSQPDHLPASYHNFLHQTCQDSGWTPLHYAAISGCLKTVELLLHCEYTMNYDKKATYKNKTYQLLPILYIESNDTLTWRRNNTNTQVGSSGKSTRGGGPRSGGITARQLIEFVKNGQHKKEIESHGMALEETVEYYHLNSNSSTKNSKNEFNVEKLQYLACINLIHDRLLDCEMNGYHVWDQATVEKELNKALDPVMTSSKETSTVVSLLSKVKLGEASSSSVVNSSIIEETNTASSIAISSARPSSNKKKKDKKLQQHQHVHPSIEGGPTPSSASVHLSETSVSSSAAPALMPDKLDDPVVAALLGMGFAREQIMDGVKACGGLNRATADDVVAWIFGGNESPQEQSPVLSLPEMEVRRESAVTSVETEGTTKEQGTEREKLAADQKLVAKREEQRRRNREWNSRAQARQVQEDQEKISKVATIPSNTQSASSLKQQTLRTGMPHSSTSTKASTYGSQANSSIGKIGLPTMAATISAASMGILSGASKQNTTSLTSTDTLGRRTNPIIAAGPSRGPQFQPLQVGSAVATNMYSSNNYSSGDLENMQSNDTSSVASSAEYNSLKFPPMMRSNIIEVSHYNDDATVSTIGSTPAIVIQQLPAQTQYLQSTQTAYLPTTSYYAPPGFDQSLDHTNSHPNCYMVSSEPMHSSRGGDPLGVTSSTSVRQSWSPNEFGTSYTVSDLKLSAPAYVPTATMRHSLYYDQQSDLSGAASRTENFVDYQTNNIIQGNAMVDSSLRSEPFCADRVGQTNRLASFVSSNNPSSDGFFSHPTTIGLTSNPRDHLGLESDVMAGSFISSSMMDTGSVPFSLAMGTSNSTAGIVPGLNIGNFGASEVVSSLEPHLEASLIESISTGTSTLAWNSNAGSRAKGCSNSLLLGNVINASNQLDDALSSPNNLDHILQFACGNDNLIGTSNLYPQNHVYNGDVLGEEQIDVRLDGLETWLSRSRDSMTGTGGANTGNSNPASHSIW